jgi:hypothetical protein
MAEIDTLRERVAELEQELSKAAREINCAGPIDHRIRILKNQMRDRERRAFAQGVDVGHEKAALREEQLVIDTKAELARKLVAATIGALKFESDKTGKNNLSERAMGILISLVAMRRVLADEKVEIEK